MFPYIKEKDLAYVSTVIMEISITVPAWNQETEEIFHSAISDSTSFIIGDN